MKNHILLMGFALILLSSCKGDDPPQPQLSSFEQLNYTAIEAQKGEMTATQITVMNASSQYVLKNGAIIVYKTKVGSFGKLLIVDNGSVNQSDKLVIDMVNYNPDGSVLLSKKGVQVVVNYNFDLDAGTQTLADADQSFAFMKLGDGSKIISPELGAIFKIVSN